MALLKMKIDGEKYTVDPDKLTLGEACTLEEEFGVEDLSELNFFKPRHLRGLFFTAVKRKHPELSDEDIMTRVREGVTGEVFEDLNRQVEEAIKKEADPQSAGASAPVPASAPNGASASKTGRRRSPASTG